MRLLFSTFPHLSEEKYQNTLDQIKFQHGALSLRKTIRHLNSLSERQIFIEHLKYFCLQSLKV